jgi:YfiH family protein
MTSYLTPNWPAPNNIRAYVTTRKGGYSKNDYNSFNLATHVGDDNATVEINRKHLQKTLQLPAEPFWLTQVRGTHVIALDEIDIKKSNNPDADGSWTTQPNKICVVMSADCLPVLLCDQKGTCVSALHAGWRGLASGILETGIKSLPVPASQLMAWLGPAISIDAYEIGEEVRQEFLKVDANAEIAFRASNRAGHWYVDLYEIARQRLRSVGVTQIYGGEYCTHRDQELFYSYRRDGKTGRMASLIYLM